MIWRFNGNYKDLEQVRPFLPAFEQRRAELCAAGRYPYNDDFRGHIGVDPTPHPPTRNVYGTEEDTAIYLLQTLHKQVEQDEKLAARLAEGYEPIERLDPGHIVKFRRVVLYSADRTNFQGDWAEYEDARLVAVEDGRIRYLLPKGARTRGHLVTRDVLVLR